MSGWNGWREPPEDDTILLARRLSSGFFRLGRAVHDRSGRGLNHGQSTLIQAILLLTQQPGAASQAVAGVKASAISKKLGVAQPTITPVLNRLEQMGYIRRSIDSSDRRIVLVSVTPRGLKVYQRVMDAERQKVLALVEYLSPQEAQKLAELVEKSAHFYREVYPCQEVRLTLEEIEKEIDREEQE